MQQQFYDLITRESGKLINLKHVHSIVDQDRTQKKIIPDNEKDEILAAEKERREKMEFEEEIKRDAEEKQMLLQATINEAEESGFPLPKSLIKLLHSQNGNFFSSVHNIN